MNPNPFTALREAVLKELGEDTSPPPKPQRQTTTPQHTPTATQPEFPLTDPVIRSGAGLDLAKKLDDKKRGDAQRSCARAGKDSW